MGRFDYKQASSPAAYSTPAGADVGSYRRAPVYRRQKDAQTARLNKDFSTLMSKGAAEVDDWAYIGDWVVRAAQSEDESARQQAAYMLSEYKPQLMETLKLSNTLNDAKPGELAEPMTYDELVEQAGDYGPTGVGGGIKGAMDWLQAPVQGVMHGIAGLAEGDLAHVGSSLEEGVTKFLTPGFEVPWETEGFDKRWRTDAGGDLVSPGLRGEGPGLANMREAIGFHKDAGGRWAGAADMALEAVVDPLSWVGLGLVGRGGGGAAKHGIAQLRGSGTAGGRIADDILEKGLKSLKPDDLSFARDVWRQQADEVATALSRQRGLGRISSALKPKMGAAEATEAGVRKAGQRGVRFAERTVLPSGRLGTKATKALNRARSSDFGKTIRRLFVDEAPVEDIAGLSVGKAAKGAKAQGRSVGTREGIQFKERFLKPAQKQMDKYGTDEVLQNLELVHKHFVQGVKADAAQRAILDEIPQETVRLGIGLGDHLRRISGTTDAASPTMMRRPALTQLDENLRHLATKDNKKLGEALRGYGRATDGTDGPLASLIGQADDGGLRVSKSANLPLQPAGPGKEISRFDPLDAMRKTDQKDGLYSMWARRTATTMNEDVERHVDNIMGEGWLAQNVPEMSAEAGNGIFMDDILSAAAARDSAFQRELTDGMMWHDLASARVVGELDTAYEGMPLIVREGNPLLKSHKGLYNRRVTGITRAEGAGAPWERINYYVPDEMADAVHGASKLINDDETAGLFKNLMHGWQKTWGAHATVPFYNADMGFHSRNSMGNIFNMMLAGFKDPTLLADAARLQRTISRAKKEMRRSGDTFGTSLARVSDNATDTELAESVWRYLAPGGMAHDVTKDDFAKMGLQHQRRGERFARGFNPLDADSFAPIQWGSNMGTAIENNARIALYIDGLQQGLDPAAARDRVYTHLFDYADLTQFEHGVRRYANRFYTFTRKNVPLQIRTMATTPGRTLNAERVMGAFRDIVSGEGDSELEEGTAVQDWHRRLVENTNAHWSAKNAIGIETPFTQAVGILTAGVGLASEIQPVADMLDAVGIKAGEDGLKDANDQFLSGPIPGALQHYFDEKSGTDSFSGSPLSPSTWGFDGQLARYMEVVAPFMHDMEGAYDIATDQDFTTSGTQTAKGGDLFKLEVLNRALGFNVVHFGNVNYQAEAARGLRNSLEHGNREGELFGDVPTWTELEEEGKGRVRNSLSLGLLLDITRKGIRGWQNGSPEVLEMRQRAGQEMRRLTSSEVGIMESYLGMPIESYVEDLEGIWAEPQESNDDRRESMALSIAAFKAEFEQNGGTWTDEIQNEVALMLVDPNVAHAEQAGFSRGVDRSRNRFDYDTLNADVPTDDALEAEDLAEGLVALEDLAYLTGKTPEEYRAEYPWLEYIPYQIQQAANADAKVPVQEVLQYLFDDLTQESKEALFGPSAVQRETWEEQWADPDMRQEHVDRISKTYDELVMFSHVYGIPVDTVYGQLAEIAAQNELTIQEQYGGLGYREPKRSRAESRPDEAAQGHGYDIMSLLREQRPDVTSHFVTQ